MFDTQIINLGVIKERTTHVATFYYKGNGVIRKNIDNTDDISKSNCGCQIQEYDPINRKITVSLKPKAVPIQNIDNGKNYYDKNQVISATFIENGIPKQYQLQILAKVINDNYRP